MSRDTAAGFVDHYIEGVIHPGTLAPLAQAPIAALLSGTPAQSDSYAANRRLG